MSMDMYPFSKTRASFRKILFFKNLIIMKKKVNNSIILKTIIQSACTLKCFVDSVVAND